MQLTQIDRRSGLTREQFKNEYLDPRIPVVLTDLIDTWPAKNKWTYDFFISKYGHIEIPIFDKSYSKPGNHYLAPNGKMKFGDYLNKIQQGPCDIRIFLLNILNKIPELKQDLGQHKIMDGFLDSLPFMFFGGQGSYTRIHFDIDCSHVFLTHFISSKRILLFAPDQSRLLGRIPFTVGCLIDMINPDENLFPSLKNIKGYETMIGHGETIFIPSQFWHHIEYTESGYSIAYRANEKFTTRAKGVMNLATTLLIDKPMNRIFGQKWWNFKTDYARKNQIAG